MRRCGHAVLQALGADGLHHGMLAGSDLQRLAGVQEDVARLGARAIGAGIERDPGVAFGNAQGQGRAGVRLTALPGSTVVVPWADFAVAAVDWTWKVCEVVFMAFSGFTLDGLYGAAC